MNSIILKVDAPTDKPQFYADSETLKEGSGYYSFMNSLPENKDMWVENCFNCKVKMQKIVLGKVTTLEVIPGTDVGVTSNFSQWTPQYRAYKTDPSTVKLNPNTDYWFCPVCESVWTQAVGAWIRVRINGCDTLEFSRVQLLPSLVQEVKMETPFDPGEKPSEDSTKCTCGKWRKVLPYESYPGDGLNRTHHVCEHCNSSEIFEAKLETPQEA